MIDNLTETYENNKKRLERLSNISTVFGILEFSCLWIFGFFLGIFVGIIAFVIINCSILGNITSKLSAEQIDLEKQIKDSKVELDSLTKEVEINNKKREAEAKISKYSSDIENKVLSPLSPKDIISKLRYILVSSKASELTKTELENNETKIEIIEALANIAKPVTISELMSYDEKMSMLSNQRLSALLKQLVDEKRVIKVVDRMKSYFAVDDNAFDEGTVKKEIVIDTIIDTDFSKDCKTVAKVINEVDDSVEIKELLQNSKLKNMTSMRVCQVLMYFNQSKQVIIKNNDGKLFLKK